MSSSVPLVLDEKNFLKEASRNSLILHLEWKEYVIPQKEVKEDNRLRTESYQFLPPGKGSFITRRFTYSKYGEHRKRIRNAKKKVDNSPPRVHPSAQIKSYKKWREEEMLLAVQRGNEFLVSDLMDIVVNKGRIDNSPPQTKRKYRELPRGVARRRYFLELTYENEEIFAHLSKVTPTIKTNKLLKEWEHNKRAIIAGCRFPIRWKIKQPDPDEPDETEEIVNGKTIVRKPRLPKCFFDVWSSGAPLGRIVIRLRSDIVPQTSANFLCYCTGQLDKSYKGCEFHHVVTDTLMKSGDVLYKNGTSGRSIYGPTFSDENFYLKHWCQGIVSMANRGPDTNNSQFFITMKPLPTLDGKHVVFGKVINGFDTLIRINNLATATGRPKRKIIIQNCGLLD